MQGRTRNEDRAGSKVGQGIWKGQSQGRTMSREGYGTYQGKEEGLPRDRTGQVRLQQCMTSSRKGQDTGQGQVQDRVSNGERQGTGWTTDRKGPGPGQGYRNMTGSEAWQGKEQGRAWNRAAI